MKTLFARSSGVLACVGFLTQVVASPGYATENVRALQAAYGVDRYALFEDGGVTVLETAAGDRVELPLSSLEAIGLDATGAEVSDLAATPQGWLVAGSARRDGGLRTLFFLAPNDDPEAETQARLIRGPKGQDARLRQGAVILQDQGRLAGLAWLEGENRRELAVKASEWTGSRWRTPRTVARPGPGSQLALSGTVLTDGSWLLAWSAFDGEDDEVLWSRRIGERWSDPARLSTDNRVPDITPTLTACGTGALVAWSRYQDGHYHLHLARFDGADWVEERTAGGPGTIHPVFLPAETSEARLLVRDAAARGWSLVDLDARGLEVLRADARQTPSSRPLVVPGADGESRFRWAGDGPMELEWRPVSSEQKGSSADNLDAVSTSSGVIEP